MEKTLSGTNANSVILASSTPDETYPVLEVNGSETLPLKNIDPNMNFLLGLEKDKLYSFSYYTGTIPREISIFADVRVFQSTNFVTLTAPIKKTSNGYFIVNLPVNLPSGYYYICNIGFFKYESGNEALDSMPIDNASSKDSEEVEAPTQEADGIGQEEPKENKEEEKEEASAGGEESEG